MIRNDMWFSITARMNAAVQAAISRIGEDGWTPIQYPNAVWEADDTFPDGGYWVSDTEVAETCFTAFSSKKKAHRVGCRLIVRRVRRLQPQASDGTVQGELFAAHRHHAFITNSPLSTIAADQHHRDHAIIEQVIAELKDGPPGHLPSAIATRPAGCVSALPGSGLPTGVEPAELAPGGRTYRLVTLSAKL